MVFSGFAAAPGESGMLGNVYERQRKAKKQQKHNPTQLRSKKMRRQKNGAATDAAIKGGRCPLSHTSPIIQSRSSSHYVQFTTNSPSQLSCPGLNQFSMMSCRRLTAMVSVRPRLAVRTYAATVARLSGENRMQANDPTPPTTKPNVSGTNTVPTDSVGVWDATLQEDPAAAEKLRSLQAPNRANTWAASQQPREKAMVGPRFEQTIMETQVC